MTADGKFGVKTATKRTQSQKSKLTACPVARPLLSAAAIAALAQLVEHIIRNDGVTCSSHVSGTSPPQGNFRKTKGKRLSAQAEGIGWFMGFWDWNRGVPVGRAWVGCGAEDVLLKPYPQVSASMTPAGNLSLSLGCQVGCGQVESDQEKATDPLLAHDTSYDFLRMGTSP